MSIVLVIIGLIVGGVLVGRDLISTANIRAQIKQIYDLQTGINTFRGKYDCLPGDCPNATSFMGSTDAQGNAIVNGNGNGLVDTIDGVFYDNATSVLWSQDVEMQQAFVQLAAAHMFGFTPTNAASPNVGVSNPATMLNPQAGFFLGASYNFFTSGRVPNISNYQTGYNALWFVHCFSGTSPGAWDDNCGIFTAAQLSAIDQKIDDGAPLSGKLYGFGGFGSNNACLSGSGASYTYNTSITTPQCQAAFVIN